MNAPLIKHPGEMHEGTFRPYNLELFIQEVNSLEGRQLDLMFKPRKKPVSVDQHSYYRGGIIPTCLQYDMFSHMEPDDVHDHFADLFLSYTKTLMIKGRYRDIRKYHSTADLSKQEMTEFIEKVIYWCAEHGILIKTPQEYYLEKYRTV